MAIKHVSLVMRGSIGGKRVNWGLERAKREGLTGSYWLKWGDNWDGPYKDEWAAKAAKVRKEREFRGLGPAIPTGNRIMLTDAIARFVEIKRTESQDGRSADRWKWELDLFQKVSDKAFVDEITKEDSYKYWRYFQERKREPRTIYNRLR